MKKRASGIFGLLLAAVLMGSYAPMAFAQTVVQTVPAERASMEVSAMQPPDDAQPPVIASVTPESGTTIFSSNIAVQARGVSDPSGIKDVSFVVYNHAEGLSSAASFTAGNGGNGVWSKNVDFSSLGNKSGDYIVNVWTRDNKDNAGITGSATIHYTGVSDRNDKIEALIGAAEAQLGKRYVRGGKGPDVFDCSGLVYYALQSSGNKIPYMTSRSWAASSYPRVDSLNDLQRGDIVCFRGHVGIYLGDGTMLDASHSRGKVRMTYNIQSSSYWQRNFICGRRPL